MKNLIETNFDYNIEKNKLYVTIIEYNENKTCSEPPIKHISFTLKDYEIIEFIRCITLGRTQLHQSNKAQKPRLELKKQTFNAI